MTTTKERNPGIPYSEACERDGSRTTEDTLIRAETKKNLAALYCPREECRSLILRPGTATLVEKKEGWKKLADPNQLAPKIPPPHSYWLVDNMMTFENIGFSKGVGENGLRLLACADCDHGPVGYHNPPIADQGSKEYLIATERVRYRFPEEDEEGK